MSYIPPQALRYIATAPEATEAKAGTVCDLAMPGEGAFFLMLINANRARHPLHYICTTAGKSGF